jgi:hypothetical protein
MNEYVGPQEDFSTEVGKGGSNLLNINGFATVEHYEGPEKVFTADNGASYTFAELCKKTKEEISSLFKSIGQGIEHRAENMEAGFVEWFGLFLRPANIATLINKPNLVTTNGKQTVAARMRDVVSTDAPKNPTGIEIGIGTASPAVGNTDVASTISGGFASFVSGYPQAGATDDITLWKSSWAAGTATGSITEAVMKSADASADAISRITFTAVAKGENDTLSVQFQWTFA